jgi:hypothetical protein
MLPQKTSGQAFAYGIFDFCFAWVGSASVLQSVPCADQWLWWVPYPRIDAKFKNCSDMLCCLFVSLARLTVKQHPQQVQRCQRILRPLWISVFSWFLGTMEWFPVNKRFFMVSNFPLTNLKSKSRAIPTCQLQVQWDVEIAALWPNSLKINEDWTKPMICRLELWITRPWANVLFVST